MSDLIRHLERLVTANRILAREAVVDAFGHVSVRHPTRPDRYLLSRSRSPELVTVDDIMEFRLDGEAEGGGDRTAYGERMIHGALYAARPEVGSVIHNHAHEVLPFSVTGAPLRPLTHVCAPIGYDIPVWDIREEFGDTDLLVVTMAQGESLARCLGSRPVALMRGHGAVIAARTLEQAVMTAVYLRINAKLQMQSLALGTPAFLSEGEVARCIERQFSPLALDRSWEYWCVRAGREVA